METTGEKIKRFRKLRGFTQKELSALVGIVQTTLAGIEAGKTKTITIDLGIRFSDRLNVSFLELFSIPNELYTYGLELIQELKTEIEMLKQTLKDKDEIIELLDKLKEKELSNKTE
jgi:transcriptional regulator with XRE-family HTH domain